MCVCVYRAARLPSASSERGLAPAHVAGGNVPSIMAVASLVAGTTHPVLEERCMAQSSSQGAVKLGVRSTQLEGVVLLACCRSRCARARDAMGECAASTGVVVGARVSDGAVSFWLAHVHLTHRKYCSAVRDHSQNE